MGLWLDGVSDKSLWRKMKVCAKICGWFKSPKPKTVEELLKELIMKADELVAQLKAATDSLTAVGDELDVVKTETGSLLDKIAALQGQVNNGDLPQSVVDAVNAVATQAGVVASKVKAVDDLVPDAPATP